MSDSRHSINKPHHPLLYEMPTDIIGLIEAKLSDKNLAQFSQSCLGFYKMTKEELRLRKFQKFLQAVLDNDKKTVINLLERDLNLLLVKPENLIVESKKTWQRFYAEYAWQMALKRKQARMLHLLATYIHKLDKIYQKAIFTQWQTYCRKKTQEVERQNVSYRQLIQALADVISKEPCCYGYQGQFLESTETALTRFRNATLPEAAIKLDDYFDIHQLLIVAHEVYAFNVKVFNQDQRRVFCINIIGWIQTLAEPELGEIFCEGLSDVIKNGKIIGKRSAAHYMKDGTKLYRSSRYSLETTGGRYLCNEYHHATQGNGGGQAALCVEDLWLGHGGTAAYLKLYVEENDAVMNNMMQQLHHLEETDAKPKIKRPGCTMS